MRVRSVLVLCVVCGGIGAGVDHYWDVLVPMVRAHVGGAQTAAPAAEQKKDVVEVLGDRVRCDVRFGELHLANEDYRAFFDACMGGGKSAAAQ
jgi:hypothetical protein